MPNPPSLRTPLFSPSPGRVLVSPFEDGMSPSGRLFLPKTGREKPMMGRVTEIAPIGRTMLDYLTDPTDSGTEGWVIKEGNVVLFGANSGMEVEVPTPSGNIRRIVLKESEILMKVEWEEQPTCPGCGAKVFAEDEACPRCHRELMFNAPVAICPVCDQIRPDNEFDCPHCQAGA